MQVGRAPALARLRAPGSARQAHQQALRRPPAILPWCRWAGMQGVWGAAGATYSQKGRGSSAALSMNSTDRRVSTSVAYSSGLVP